MTHIVVVGAGIAGLSAAYELRGGGGGPTAATPHVTVLEGSAELGGKLRAEEFGTRIVDVGPDGFLARRPEALSLIAELGASERLEPIAAHGAYVLARGRVRPLPSGLALGVPTKVRDAVGILGVFGSLRAAVDLVAPRQARRSALPDRAIGPLVADKLGRRVVDTLVDPLVGGIHAGRVKDLSAAAVYPLVLDAGQRRGSMIRALRAATPLPTRHDDSDGDAEAPPVFFTLASGLGSLPSLIASVLESQGATVRTGAQVTSIRRGVPGAQRWVVEAHDESIVCDAVVLATPPMATAALVRELDIDTAAMLSTIDVADVAVITLLFADADVALPETGTGVLIPSGSTFADTSYLTTAVSFLDRKWAHLRREGEVLVRASVGRSDDPRFEAIADDALLERVTDELTSLLDMRGQPIDHRITRWPGAFPQYRVNHLVRVDGIETAARALGGVAVCGATYRGVGVPACIASGRTAARSVRAWLADQS